MPEYFSSEIEKGDMILKEQFLYRQLFASVCKQISNGEYAVGKYLPSLRHMAAESGMSIITIRRAYKLLADTGYVKAVHGKGYCVISNENTNAEVRDETDWINIALMLLHKYKKEQYTFPHPVEENLKSWTGESCRGIAEQIKTHTASDNDFGVLSMECAILILNKLAESMNADETLEEYFQRNAVN